MPNAPTNAREGHGAILGVDTRTPPNLLTPQFATNAVNRTWRGGNRTRPVFQTKSLTFDTEEAEQEFKIGNVQGAIGYQKHFKNTQPHIIVAAGKKILKGRVYGDTISFSTLWDLETPEYRHAWFVQGEDRLYYQNGRGNPIGWNGRAPAYEIKGGIASNTMPIGTLMAYIHGRLVVFTEDNYALTSDFIYGNGLTNTKGLEAFNEIQFYGDMGAIPTPAMLGDIVGAIPVPRTPNRNAQGDLLVMCRNGAYTLALAGTREQWWLEDVQQIVLTGTGGASDKSLVAANNDIWFRTSDGSISSYKFERSDQDLEWGDTSLAMEVTEYLKFDSPKNLQYSSSIKAHNRLLTSCAIQVSPNALSGYGQHRYGEGIVALDFDRGSTVNRRTGFSWDGLWTGINPVQFVQVDVDSERRSLCISHDDDGQNRIYEIMPDSYKGSDMADGTSKAIVGFYDLPTLFYRDDPQVTPVLKEVIGWRAEFKEVRESAKIGVKYRPADYPCQFTLANPVTVGCEEPCDPESVPQATDIGEFYGTVRGGVDEVDCLQGSARTSKIADNFNVRVEVEGGVTIPKFQVIVNVKHDEQAPTCTGVDNQFCDLIKCCNEGIFSYKIVDGPEPAPETCEDE